MCTWLLIAGTLLFAGSTTGFIRLQFSNSNPRLTLFGSALMMVATLYLAVAVWIGRSGQLSYSVDGLSLQDPQFHFRRP